MANEGKKTQHLTIYMLKRSVKRFADALEKPEEAGEARPIEDENFDGELYLPETGENVPGWAGFLGESFEQLDIRPNRISAALLFVKGDKRSFVVTFGHAWRMLDANRYERDFGLRVVTNRVKKDSIRSLSLRMFRETSLKRHDEAAKGTQLSTFGVDIQQDLLRAVTGVPDDDSFATRLSGADSLAFSAKMTFADLGAKCRELEKAYIEKGYQKRGFGWIDNLKHLRDEILIQELNQKLLDALKARSEEVEMLAPEQWGREQIGEFVYSGQRSGSGDCTELNIADWFEETEEKLADLTIDDLANRKVRAFAPDGTPLGAASEHECFVFETEGKKGEKYVLSNGQWFEVSVQFDQEISSYLHGISQQAVNLPPSQPAWDEDKYVAQISNQNFASMHKKTCKVGGSVVEVCDILTSDGKLVHVKRWTASATFSHLLAQGAISAETLFRDQGFRDQFRRLVPRGWSQVRDLFPGRNFACSKVEVVLALIRKSKRSLPFFSRLNLMREGKRIEAFGYRVVYQRIDVAAGS